MGQLSKYRKMIRPFDIIVTVLLLVFSFTPLVVFARQQAQVPQGAQLVAVVTIGRDVVARFPLEEGGEQFTVLYTSEDGLRGEQYNIIEVDGDRIRVKEDNSPDQIAVNTGWISRVGQTSICLPHQLMIRIEATHPHQADEEIIIAG